MKKIKIDGARSSFDENFESFDDIKKYETIKLIGINDIAKNKLNYYGQFDSEEDIELLANNIYESNNEHQPLQPLTVYLSQKDEKYIIVSGEKRYKACKLNISRYDDAPKNIRCIVIDAYSNSNMTPQERQEANWREFDEISKHNKNRDFSDEELYVIARPYIERYKFLEENGQKPAGEKRKWLAERLPSCGIKKAERLIHVYEGKKSGFKTSKETNMNDNGNKNKDNNVSQDDFELQAKSIEKRIEDATNNRFKVKVKRKSLTFSFKDMDELNDLLKELHFNSVLDEV